ncbi:MAG: phosphate signaling complex protein PhoU [Bacteriovoracaceae bacterium]|nr:phosphate signaling complex protein PhoU [Bacteriovoracaceae bacterium]
MSMHLEKELEILKKKILSLSSLVEESLQKAALVMRNGHDKLALEIIDCDEQIDLKEVEVEEDCLKILALHQPVASNLRFVIAILKINNDLERVGDLCVNIAERVRFLIQAGALDSTFDFTTMVDKTRSMLSQSLNALIQMDLALAKNVMQADNEVDALHKATYDQVYRSIGKHPEKVKELVNYLSISRNLERIADYATNIAEDVIYMIEGVIVRHRSL